MNIRGILNGVLLVALTLTALLFPVTPVQSEASPQKVLLLYDSLAKGTAREGNVTELQRLLAAYSAKVTLKSLDQYEQGMLANYSRVIMVRNAADILITNKFYAEDWEHYQGQYLHIGYSPPDSLRKKLQLTTDVMYSGNADLQIGQFSDIQLQVQDMPYIAASEGARSYGKLTFQERGLQVPYAVSGDSETYVPYFEQDNASVLAMGYVLKDWLHITVNPKMYLAIKEIYPFSDLSLLAETAERLYQVGIPFLASVRPVFSNTDYPAMQRYLVAMKNVQSRNGSILVNAPVVMPSIGSSDHTLHGKMNDFINLLASNGIGPLGVGAQTHWTYDKEYSEAGMSFFDSAVLYPDEHIDYMEQTDTSKSFLSSLYSVPIEFIQDLHSTNKMFPELPMDTVITVDMPKNEQELEEMLQTLERYWVSFADYKQERHKVVTDVNTILSSGGVISINGQLLSLDYKPEAVDSNYQYKEEHKKSFTRLFDLENQFFIVVIMISLLLFGGLLIIGYRLYRKKYLK
ncbi:hypothetical protein [Paenibacillus sp. FSL R10-2734]|uniref:hypothetical protein n=1 Tax=Paenibacillus sp. FSL R10-2734 TaxID=2954691 RepID=UPI0030D820D8